TDVYPVAYAVSTGMAHPLPSGHKLPFHVFPEGVAHAAVAAGKPGTGGDGFYDILPRRLIDRAHGPAGNDQILRHHKLQVLKRFLVIVNPAGIAVFFHDPGETLRNLLRLMTVPSSPEN